MKYFLSALIILASCSSKRTVTKITFDQHLLDSVKRKADTSYSKRYRTEEFTTADYYVNRKDTSVCQVMKDDSGRVRQVIMARKAIRLYTAEYFSNGQLKAKLNFDSLGRLSGPCVYYYESGMVKSEGGFQAGIYTGEWKNYKENGKLERKDQFDSSGALINSVPAS